MKCSTSSVGAEAGRHGEGPKIIGHARDDRSEIIGQAAKVGLPFALPLLPEHAETQPLLCARLVGVNDDIVAIGVGREEAIDAAGFQHRPGR